MQSQISIKKDDSKSVMSVINRRGEKVPVEFDKITQHIRKYSYGLEVDPGLIAQKVIKSMIKNMHVREINRLAAEISESSYKEHIDYLTLASRLVVSDLHQDTPATFSEAMRMVHHNSLTPPETDSDDGFFSKEFMQAVRTHGPILDKVINHDADYNFNYFGICTLIKYLNTVQCQNKKKVVIVERPQYLFMRVALFLYMDNLEMVLKNYRMFSQQFFTHASPTLLNAGKVKCQCSSCFLGGIHEDTLECIYNTLTQCALIQKNSGGLGISVHGVRAKNARIKTSGGLSNGIIPMLKVFNETLRYVNQGGKRKGAGAFYIEPWHADIFAFLDLRKNNGKEEERARDLHMGLWISDLFMERVLNDEQWTLFSPDTVPGLNTVWGEEFKQLYQKYELLDLENKKVIRARQLWEHILDTQIETGEPYMLYKDACNSKSNQQNLGTIQCSNLCTEILEYTAIDEVAVCNLASICLPKCVKNGAFNHQLLYDITYQIILNLNRVIDLNYYPIEEAKNSNLRHRPVGVGIQGLADVFGLLSLPFDSKEAKVLNREISETIYYAALCASKDLAKIDGPYQTYQGSPASKGLLQYDLWKVTPSDRWDWKSLKEEIKQHGLRNSQLVALMPTASTSQIMGYNECFEPYTYNLYVRRTDAGEFTVLNPHLFNALYKEGLWTPQIIDQIIAYNGSIQNIPEIPDNIKVLFKTAYEVGSKTLLNMSADRGAFVDQSQSLNVFIHNPRREVIHKMHIYAWKIGLKTGMYYLRSEAAVDPIKFTLDPSVVNESKKQLEQKEKQSSKKRSINTTTENKENSQENTEEENTQSDSLKQKKPKSSTTYMKNGKMFVCEDEVCTSCSG